MVGTFGVMYVASYSIDNLSLMGLTIAVGFVVDDAIVMIENIVRYIEEGRATVRRGAEGRGPDRLHHYLDHLLADRGLHPAAVHGRHRRPAVPGVRRGGDGRRGHVGLRVAHPDAGDVRPVPQARDRTTSAAGFNQLVEDAFDAVVRFYDRGLQGVCATSS